MGSGSVGGGNPTPSTWTLGTAQDSPQHDVSDTSVSELRFFSLIRPSAAGSLLPAMANRHHQAPRQPCPPQRRHRRLCRRVADWTVSQLRALAQNVTGRIEAFVSRIGKRPRRCVTRTRSLRLAAQVPDEHTPLAPFLGTSGSTIPDPPRRHARELIALHPRRGRAFCHPPNRTSLSMCLSADMSRFATATALQISL